MRKLIYIAGTVAILMAVGGAWLYGQQEPASQPAAGAITKSVQGVQPSSSAPQQVRKASTGAPRTAMTGTPAIGPVSATPTSITVNMPTAVTVTVQITDSSIIPNSVNLLRLGATGTQPTILGVMQSAGNGAYSLEHVFNETSAGQIQLQVSAAFRGLLKRILSQAILLPVFGTFTDPTTNITITFPPVGPQVQIVPQPLTNGAISALNLDLFDSSQQAMISVAGIAVYDNPGGLTLTQWFENNVDVNGILEANNVFQGETLRNGISAFVLSGPVPSSYLDLSGPVAQIYAISPSGRYVISMAQAQEAQLTDYGYDGTSTLINMLSMMQFP